MSKNKTGKSKNSDLNEKLLDNAVQMSSKSGPKSFFNRDADETGSVSQSAHEDTEQPETMESVGYRWDFAIVLPTTLAKDASMESSEVIQLLYKTGLQLYLYKSIQQDEIIIKLRATLRQLKTHADLINYKMVLDSEELKERVGWGLQSDDGSEYIIKPVSIPHIPEISSLLPYEYIYSSYRADDEKLFACADGLTHAFSSQHRIRLIMSMLTKKGPGFGNLNLPALVKDGSILAFYPLHDLEALHNLEKAWLPWNVMPWSMPIDDIRDYFGEKIGLYFEFLGHYTTWLLPLSVAGVIVTFDIIIESGVYGDYAKGIGSSYTMPFFALFVSIWAQLMLEYWKRTEATKSMEWGTSNFESEEIERDGFSGQEMRSIVNGSSIKYFSPEEKQKRSNFSNFIISLMVLLVIMCVGLIFYIKFYMVVQSNNSTVNAYGGITASIANAIQIQVLNAVYQELALWLTIRENHRTTTEYEDALISKLFAFQFVNSFASFFYIAFIKNLIGDPCAGSCMSELSIAIATIFGTRLVVGNAQEVLIPLISGWYKQRQESQGQGQGQGQGDAKGTASATELQYSMESYDPMMGTLEDYAELAVQYGYLTLFVAAFPLGPLLGYLSNIVEIRTDGWKLLHAYRRALPSGAQDIGSWMSILQITSGVAVITNAGILVFTMDLFDVRDDYRVWIFVFFQYFVFVIMAVFAFLVDDVPEEVTIQLQRQEFLVQQAQRIADAVPDEDDSYLQLHVATDDEAPINYEGGDDEAPPLSGKI